MFNVSNASQVFHHAVKFKSGQRQNRFFFLLVLLFFLFFFFFPTKSVLTLMKPQDSSSLSGKQLGSYPRNNALRNKNGSFRIKVKVRSLFSADWQSRRPGGRLFVSALVATHSSTLINSGKKQRSWRSVNPGEHFRESARRGCYSERHSDPPLWHHTHMKFQRDFFCSLRSRKKSTHLAFGIHFRNSSCILFFSIFVEKCDLLLQLK